jgi:hypothetical protein
MAEGNQVPVQQWLQVWEHTQNARDVRNPTPDALGALCEAVEKLYLLLEPASVREARRTRNDAVLVMVAKEEDE